MEDIGRAFSFPFEDREWFKKLLIAGLVGIVPILNFALLGYILEVMESVVEGRLATLPDWSDLGFKWRRGLLPALAMLLYMIPMYVLFCAGYIPLIFFSSVTSSTDSSQAGPLVLVFYLGMCLVYAVIMVYLVVLALLAPFLAGMYLEAGDFGSLFRIREAFAMLRANVGDALIVLLLAWVGTMIGAIGFYLCFFPGLITMPYGYLIIGHLYGQLYRKARGQLRTAL